jgi:hypothetical protein
MKSILSLFVVCLVASTAAAQFGGKNALPRNAARPAETTQKKTTTEKGHPAKANAEDQAAAETEMVNAILLAMDTDKDGVVTKIEYGKALAALRKVHKDGKGNMVVPDGATPATPADPNAAGAGANAGQAQPGAGVGVNNRANNEAMAWFVQNANRNGVMDLRDVPPQMRNTLQAADRNRDGVVDAGEWQLFSARMGERMKAVAAGVNPNGAGGVPGDGRAPKP